MEQNTYNSAHRLGGGSPMFMSSSAELSSDSSAHQCSQEKTGAQHIQSANPAVSKPIPIFRANNRNQNASKLHQPRTASLHTIVARLLPPPPSFHECPLAPAVASVPTEAPDTLPNHKTITSCAPQHLTPPCQQCWRYLLGGAGHFVAFIIFGAA